MRRSLASSETLHFRRPERERGALWGYFFTTTRWAERQTLKSAGACPPINTGTMSLGATIRERGYNTSGQRTSASRGEAISASRRKRLRYQDGSSPTEAHLIKLGLASLSLDLPAKTPTSFQNCLSKVRWEALCRAGSGLRRVRPHSRAALGWIGRLNIGAVCAHLSPTRNDDDAPIRGRLSNDTERLPPTSHDETGSRAGGMAGI